MSGRNGVFVANGLVYLFLYLINIYLLFHLSVLYIEHRIDLVWFLCCCCFILNSFIRFPSTSFTCSIFHRLFRIHYLKNVHDIVHKIIACLPTCVCVCHSVWCKDFPKKHIQMKENKFPAVFWEPRRYTHIRNHSFRSPHILASNTF